MRFLLLGLVACDGVIPSTDKEEEDLGPGLSFEPISGQTNPSGLFRVEFEVPEGTASFQVTAFNDQRVLYEKLIAPDGTVVLDWEDWAGTGFSLTGAFYGDEESSALSWPVRDVDGPLVPGLWTVVIAVVDPQSFYYQGGEPVDVSIALKKDPDLSTGRVGVQIVYADGVDGDPAVVTAIESAVERWRTVWAGIDIELVEHYESSRIDPDLPFAFGADPSVANVAGRKGEGELQLIVGETVGNDFGLYGVSAGIPGTIEVSTRSFVVLSWLTHAGTDAVFDPDEIRLMGETMAHEIGHYAGLFHPVEADYANWDALDDTPDCQNAGTCEEQLGDNLMFPYSLCNFEKCFAQGQITVQQASVVQTFVGAL